MVTNNLPLYVFITTLLPSYHVQIGRQERWRGYYNNYGRNEESSPHRRQRGRSYREGALLHLCRVPIRGPYNPLKLINTEGVLSATPREGRRTRERERERDGRR